MNLQNVFPLRFIKEDGSKVRMRQRQEEIKQQKALDV